MDHINFKTKKAYQGGNKDTLQVAKNENSFTSNKWLTFVQARSMGCKIKPGSKGIRIRKYIIEEKIVKGRKEKIFAYKMYTVFNLDQVAKV